MTWKDYQIYKREDDSFIIIVNEAPYHVPNEGEWVELYAEVADYYDANEDCRSDHEIDYMELHPELQPEPEPKPTFEGLKTLALSKIDNATSKTILAGFDYTINNEILHFSYDSFDQQNFADTANACLMSMSGVEGLPQSVTWNGWRNHTKDYKGDLVRLVLDVDAFITLYVNGALIHKSKHMDICGERKEAVKTAETVEAIEALLAEWGM